MEEAVSNSFVHQDQNECPAAMEGEANLCFCFRVSEKRVSEAATRRAGTTTAKAGASGGGRKPPPRCNQAT
jgi:hypothetical protein